MPLKTETKTIDGLDVRVTQFGARRAHRLNFRLLRLLGPTLLPIAARGEIDLGNLDLGAALASLDEREAEPLLLEVLAGTQVVVDGRVLDMNRPEMLDAAFDGRLLTMYKAALFALQVNYGDFIGALRAVPAAAGAAAEGKGAAQS